MKKNPSELDFFSRDYCQLMSAETVALNERINYCLRKNNEDICKHCAGFECETYRDYLFSLVNDFERALNLSLSMGLIAMINEATDFYKWEYFYKSAPREFEENKHASKLRPSIS